MAITLAELTPGYHAQRVRFDSKKARADGILNLEQFFAIDAILKAGGMLTDGIQKEVRDDQRAYHGRFSSIDNRYFYGEGIQVMTGIINFRHKEYDGVEFLSSTDIDITGSLKDFVLRTNLEKYARIGPINIGSYDQEQIDSIRNSNLAKKESDQMEKDILGSGMLIL